MPVIVLEFVLSNKKKPLLLVAGYLFRKDKSLAAGGVSWRCTKTTCGARVRSRNDELEVSENSLRNLKHIFPI